MRIATYLFQISGDTKPQYSWAAPAIAMRTGTSLARKSGRNDPCSWAFAMSSSIGGPTSALRSVSRCFRYSLPNMTSRNPRFSASRVSIFSMRYRNPSHPSSKARLFLAMSMSSMMRCSNSASTRDSLLGKRRYTVPTPSRAWWATSSSVTPKPLAAKSSCADFNIRSRFSSASLRKWRRRPSGASPVDKRRCFITLNKLAQSGGNISGLLYVGLTSGEVVSISIGGFWWSHRSICRMVPG